MELEPSYLQALIRERNLLVAKIEAIRNKIIGIDVAIKLISGDQSRGVDGEYAGVKPIDLVELAARRALIPPVGSVHSLLNRLNEQVWLKNLPTTGSQN
jgi:hypothetical protein